MPDKIYVFDARSGQTLHLDKQQFIDIADDYQIPLSQKPTKSCKKCHGRLHIGKSLSTSIYIPCIPCLRLIINNNVIKDIDDKKTTT